MNITEIEREKIENWIQERTPEPPRYMLDALEKSEEPKGNRLQIPILVGFDLSNMKLDYLWYLNN